MDLIENTQNAKIIGIGEGGVNNLDTIVDKIKHTMETDKIFPNQDVDKDYVRELLDGVDVLFLTYNSEDKATLQIVNAITYMAGERRILCVGLDVATKENKDTINVDREFKMNKYSENTLVNLMNMIMESISDFCMINIDLTDIKEVLASDKAIKYSFGEFDKSVSNEEIVKLLKENEMATGEEVTGKKEIIMVELDSNFYEEASMLPKLNELLEVIQNSREDSYEGIFSLYVREKCEGKIKVGLIYN